MKSTFELPNAGLSRHEAVGFVPLVLLERRNEAPAQSQVLPARSEGRTSYWMDG